MGATPINVRVSRLSNKLRSLIKGQFVRFIIVGGVNTLYGFIIYSALILACVPVWGALACSTLSGVLFNFITTSGYVFRASSWSRLPQFFVTYVLIFCGNLGLINGLAIVVGNAILAQGILAPLMAILSYTIMKKWVFRPCNR